MVVENEKREDHQIPRIVSRTIPGHLNALNKAAIDWGWCGLIAYGCQFTVVIMDPETLQIVQTLDSHKAHIQKVRWCRREHPSASLVLASADSSGRIIVWNVREGQPITILQDTTTKSVHCLEWLYQYDNGNVLLAALHPPYSFIVWDTVKGTKQWKKTYTETLVSFDLNPFEANKLAFACTDCILLVDDLYPNRVPSSNGRKFSVSASQQQTQLEDVPSTRMRLRRMVNEFVAGDPKPRNDDNDKFGISECLQLSYHRATKDLLLLLYPRELLLLDLQLHVTVGVVLPDRSSSPFLQVYGCWQRDVLYFLHENGSIGTRIKTHAYLYDPSCEETESFLSCEGYDVNYEQKCQSDSIRITKHTRVFGFTACPRSQTKLAMTLSDGRIMFFELKHDGKEVVQTLAEYLPPTWMSADEQVRLRLHLTAMSPCVASPVLCIRMCPPLTIKNWAQYRPLLAVGTNTGAIQVVNLATGFQEKEISVHTCPTRGIEWTSLTSVLSFGSPSVTGQQLLVRNEIVHTNLLTGACTTFRTDRGEESPIEMIRVSYLKRYFVIAFKDNPFELWDLEGFIMLRNINRKFPVLTAVEWSPPSYAKLAHRRSEGRRNSSGSQLLEDLEKEPKVLQKEHFIFADTEGRRFHYIVEGSVVKDGTKIIKPPGQVTITSIAWKGESLVWGSSDGNITVWNLKTNRSLYPVNPHRGTAIKKIRFAPGKGNYRLLTLYHDGLQIWDVMESKLVERMVCPRDMVKIIDADWAASDKPVIATADGCIRVLDLTLKVTTSCMSEYAFAEPFLCPSAFGNDVLANFRMMLADRTCFEDLDHFSLPELDLPQAVSKDLSGQLQEVASSLREKLSGLSTVERCRLTALITGDEWQSYLWTIASFYLDPVSSPPLDSCFNLFCDTPVFQYLIHEETLVHECKRVTYEHTQKVIERLIMLNEMDKATQILLETDNKQSGYYADSLRACLAATLHQSQEESQSTVKLVATNLIASDKLHEGIQLLCMIKKYADSCRYMQSYGLWEDAAELAKLTLDAEEKTEAFRRWVEHLSSTEQKHKAVLVWISLKNFPKACELLLAMNNIPTAAYLIQSCQEKGVWEDSAYNKKLQSVITRELARYCQMIGNQTAHQYYVQQEQV